MLLACLVLACCCLLDAQAPPRFPNSLINRLKYYVLQLGDPNPNPDWLIQPNELPVAGCDALWAPTAGTPVQSTPWQVAGGGISLRILTLKPCHTQYTHCPTIHVGSGCFDDQSGPWKGRVHPNGWRIYQFRCPLPLFVAVVSQTNLNCDARTYPNLQTLPREVTDEAFPVIPADVAVPTLQVWS